MGSDSDAKSAPLIMVVEDNDINQEILGAQLEALGYAYAVFDDGARGLAAWRTGSYSLVLTDCDMPELDGYEMTARIRALEAETDAARIPIVATTGNEQPGELDACRAAGMDDCLTKPIELDSLRQTLEKWLSPRAGSAPAPVVAPPPTTTTVARVDADTPAVFDPHPIYDTIGRDPATIAEFVGMVMQDLQPRIDGIEPALAEANLTQAARHAHAIKGTAGAVGAGRLRAVARALEEAGKQGDGTRCRELLPQLRDSFHQLRQELDRQPW